MMIFSSSAKGANIRANLANAFATNFILFMLTHHTFAENDTLMQRLRDFEQTISKPLCEPNETCGSATNPVIRALIGSPCQCPDMQPCPTGRIYSAHVTGVRYQFCTKPNLHTCLAGEVATVTLGSMGFRKQINCQCPENTILTHLRHEFQPTRIEYTCETPSVCQLSNEPCWVREHMGNESVFRTVCQCPRGTICTESTDSTQPPMIVNGRKQERGYCK